MPDGWDDAVIALHGHVLQSAAWARVQERLGFRAIVDGGQDWCWMGAVRRAGPVRYLYIPFGPTLRTPATLAEAMRSATARAHRLGCAFVRFEPGAVDAAVIAATGARRVKPRQYEHTAILDLDADEATLRRGLAGGHRSAINAASRRGIAVEASNDPALLPAFLALLRATERRAGFYSYDDPYFEAIAAELLPSGVATLYFARLEGAAVATAMVFDYGETRYYAYGAAADAARRLSPAPPLVWQTILDARRRGATRYDLWGVAPPGSAKDHPWTGISYFKQAFGSRPVAYAGTWELTVRPLPARLFALARRLRR